MKFLKIHQEMVTEEIADQMCKICPFGAISKRDGKLEIGMGCRMCQVCVKNGAPGVITLEEEVQDAFEKSLWEGITVFAEQEAGVIHPVVYELLGKALELAAKSHQPIYVLLVGYQLADAAQELLHYGAEKVFCYDSEELAEFRNTPYVNAVEDFVKRIRPSVMMIGATVKGRSLAPRAAARFRTGLTADCTVLQIKENTDLVQIRPAFGGNIMAQIVTPNSRPQLCTVRYKVFASPERKEQGAWEVVHLRMKEERYTSPVRIVEKTEKPKEMDIADAEVIVAVGRGVKTQSDLRIIEELAGMLHAQIACTRPLIESGWFDARRQIGLSGRTVKPKLILAIGISGSVQFVAGMKGADCVIAINEDPGAAIFDVAHYGFVGNLYELLPKFFEEIKGGRRDG